MVGGGGLVAVVLSSVAVFNFFKLSAISISYLACFPLVFSGTSDICNFSCFALFSLLVACLVLYLILIKF